MTINAIILPSHIALLVPSVRKTADYLSQYNFQFGEEENWDGEGTKEIYIEKNKANSLLLMEPAQPGPYQQAMEKRGPGLHHLAVDVLNLDAFLESLSGSGWLLHPKSVKTIKQCQTAYLARPGFPGLIEVQEKGEQKPRDLFVKELGIDLDAKGQSLLKIIGLESIVKPSQEANILLGDVRVPLKQLLFPSVPKK